MKKIRFLLIGIIIILICLFICVAFIKYHDYLKIKNAVIKIEYIDDLTIEFGQEVKVSNFIKEINGKIINDYLINTNELTKKEINYEYINDDGIKLNQKFFIDIVDKTPPLIWLNKTYNIAVNSEDTLLNDIMCGDNVDNNPNCFIEGDYNLKKVGKYPLIFKAVDKSGNLSTKNFTLNVYKPNDSNNTKNPTYQKFSDIISKYKNDNNLIGIDVSEWQDYPDYEKLKNVGIEFVIIRVGGTKGKEGAYFLDKSFIYNITEANKHNILVGIYFFSYATSKEKAIENAKWVLNQIKDYQVDLPISFDWENWSKFNQYHVSFYELSQMADAFIKTVENKGYQGMNYSSKTYLENIWQKSNNTIWLAHYTDQTNYQGNYKFWQINNNVLIDGINGPVDVDIMYK